MRSLFAKIFLSFFLAVVLLGVLLEITAVRTEMRRVNTVLRPLAEEIAPRLVAAYESRGADALTGELERVPLAAALLDDHAEPLTVVPDALAPTVTAARRVLGRSTESLSGFVAWHDFALAPAQGASGRHYVVVFRLPHERWAAILNTLDEYPALRLSIVAVVAGLICFLLARHITRPLVQLREVAGRMAEGQLDARAGETFKARRDEIGALGRDFDVMADRVSALVASDRQLFADVSHELRSPLARLTVAAGLARRHAGETGASPEALAADLDRIEHEANRIDQLLGQSLTLARIDSGVDAGPREAFDLTNLVQQIASDADYEARASDRRVAMGQADACHMSGVAELVRSAIENVVRNAVRHTAPGTTVEIDLEHARPGKPAMACIQVRDHGTGIPLEQLADVFLPFRRGDARGGERSAGAGLGLAIADRVVKMHGGSIRAVNTPGGGLGVEITLALSPNAIGSPTTPP
ncbi:MAG TPA: ATP-binding protein [Vicinamibacterales bacterium]|nr:ATP-binding protein [Vicinamibacterales bacterium]